MEWTLLEVVKTVAIIAFSMAFTSMWQRLAAVEKTLRLQREAAVAKEGAEAAALRRYGFPTKEEIAKLKR